MKMCIFYICSVCFMSIVNGKKWPIFIWSSQTHTHSKYCVTNENRPHTIKCKYMHKSAHLSQTKWGNQIINIAEVYSDRDWDIYNIYGCLFDMRLYGWSVWFCFNDLLILYYLIGFCSLKISVQRFPVICEIVEFSTTGIFVCNMRFLNESDLLI